MISVKFYRLFDVIKVVIYLIYYFKECSVITIGEARKWKMDTNNERFTVIEDNGVHYGTHWFVIQYVTDGRKQTVREQDLLEKTVVLDK